MRTYLEVFLDLRGMRPDGKFADADITEFMRLAEHLGKVTDIEIQYLEENLLRDRADLFANEAQKARLRILASNHKKRNQASEDDDFVKDVLRVAAISYFRKAEAAETIDVARDLSEAIDESRDYYIAHGSDSPELIEAVNRISNELAGAIEGFTLSDVDDPGKDGREARRRNFANYFRRLTGEVDHEAKWDEDTKTWKNWNRDIEVYPEEQRGHEQDTDRAYVIDLLRNRDTIRLVAGGHAFNTLQRYRRREGCGTRDASDPRSVQTRRRAAGEACSVERGRGQVWRRSDGLRAASVRRHAPARLHQGCLGSRHGAARGGLDGCTKHRRPHRHRPALHRSHRGLPIPGSAGSRRARSQRRPTRLPAR